MGATGWHVYLRTRKGVGKLRLSRLPWRASEWTLQFVRRSRDLFEELCRGW